MVPDTYIDWPVGIRDWVQRRIWVKPARKGLALFFSNNFLNFLNFFSHGGGLQSRGSRLLLFQVVILVCYFGLLYL